MSQSQILEIKKPNGSKARQVTANLLPCRVHHTGPVDPIEAYWTPTLDEDGTRTAYFRGRKLQGKTTHLPEDSRGVVVQRSLATLKSEEIKDEGPSVIDLEAEEEPLTMGSMQVMAEFDEMVVWSHETFNNDCSDPYLRSIEEWHQVAGKIHSFDEEESTST